MIRTDSIKLRTFRILIESARQIKANTIKIRTDYEILKRNFVNADLWSVQDQSVLFLDDVNMMRELHQERDPRRSREPRVGKIVPGVGAETVRFIFKSFLVHNSVIKVRRELASLGYAFTPGRVLQVLKNPFYAAGGIKAHEERIDGVLVALLGCLISKKDFDLVQAELKKSHKRSSASNRSLLPLSSYIVDSRSKRVFAGGGHRYYFIDSKSTRWSIGRDELHGLFLQFLPAHSQSIRTTARFSISKLHQELNILIPRLAAAIANEFHRTVAVAQYDCSELLMHNKRLSLIRAYADAVNYFSSIEQFVDYGDDLILNLAARWAQSDFNGKVDIQQLTFPQGLLFQRKSRTFSVPEPGIGIALKKPVSKPNCDTESKCLVMA